VINHRDKRTGADGSLLASTAIRRMRPTTGVDYDIIANTAKPFQREFEGLDVNESFPPHGTTALPHSSLRKAGKKTHPELARKIDYDIITQKYVESDEERQEMEDALTKKILQERFDETHVFHPLQQRYFDPSVDEKERELDDKMWKDARTIKAGRIPSTMKSAYGSYIYIYMYIYMSRLNLNVFIFC
jgi:hypothetical protein